MYEVWWVEDEVVGFTPVSKVDTQPTLKQAQESAEEFESVMWKFENVTVHTGIKHQGEWVE